MNIIFETFKYVLDILFNATGDWGISIVFLTVIVKLLLLPLSLKQKKSMANQQKISREIQGIKEKHKSNSKKMEEELQDVYKNNSAQMFGCFTGFIQLPVLISLYRFFITIPIEGASIILPWILKLSIPDPYFIIPVSVVIIQLLPNILATFGVFKNAGILKLSISNVIPSLLMSLLIVVKAPVALGLYFLTSSVFTALEQIWYGIYSRKVYS